MAGGFCLVRLCQLIADLELSFIRLNRQDVPASLSEPIIGLMNVGPKVSARKRREEAMAQPFITHLLNRPCPIPKYCQPSFVHTCSLPHYCCCCVLLHLSPLSPLTSPLLLFFLTPRLFCFLPFPPILIYLSNIFILNHSPSHPHTYLLTIQGSIPLHNLASPQPAIIAPHATSVRHGHEL